MTNKNKTTKNTQKNVITSSALQEMSTTNLLHIFDDKQITPDNLKQYITSTCNTYPNTQIFSEYIANNEEGITTAKIIQNCSGYISRSYAYDILSGNTTKHPNRDIILILCISSHMDRRMTRKTLEAFHHRELYLKDPRDLIIATYINNRIYDLTSINNELYQYELPLLPEN